MCDNRDDDLPKILKKINLSNEQCKKCQGENGRAVFLLRNDDKPMCKKCFLLACVHKFRSEFGKTQIVRQGEKLLIGFSGGPSSIALLLLIKQGLAESEFRKLRFSPVFVHIFDGDCVQTEIEEILINSGFPYHLISISDLPDDRLKVVNENLYSKTKFSTAYKNAKNILLRTILCDLAVKYECSRVVVGNNCSRQSIRVLSNIAQGSASYDDTAFHDTRHNVSIIQPLRQFSVKEIIFINRFNNLSLPFSSNEETFTNKTYSIDRLTEGFIASLTSDFPSTIFTISRTAEKMTNIANEEERKQCRFCGNSFKCQNDIFGGATAANAMLFSQTLLEPLNGQVDKVEDDDDDRDKIEELCYTCRSINDEIDMALIN